jgi:hypothetical protein
MKKVAIFGDLTAMYDAKTEFKKNINYALVDKAIKDHLKIESFFRSKFYTLYHPDNPTQVNFVKMLQDNVGWAVETKQPREVRRAANSTGSPHRNYRFDAQIGFDIGESTGDDCDTIVVVSDSLELLKPLSIAAKYQDLNVIVAFFRDAMDRRWWDGLKQTEIQFLDLGEIMHSVRMSRVSEIEDSARFE